MKKWLFSVLFIGLIACNTGNKQQDGMVSEISTPFVLDSIPVDGVEDYWYPVDSLMTVPILITGEVFLGEDELDPKIADKGWFGIFRFRDKAFVEGTRIYITPEQKSEDGYITSWNIKTSHIDTAIILVSDPKLRPHEMEWVRLIKDQIQPNEEVPFTFNKQQYTLHATGLPFENKPPQDYRLYLKGMKNGKEIDQLLVSIPSFSKQYSMVTVLFVGDIDADGIPDLILDATYNYNIYAPTLYLSSRAEANELAKPVGRSIYTD